MRANDKMAKDVDIEELAKITKNFSGAELEGLVRAAQSWYVKPVLFKTIKSLANRTKKMISLFWMPRKKLFSLLLMNI